MRKSIAVLLLLASGPSASAAPLTGTDRWIVPDWPFPTDPLPKDPFHPLRCDPRACDPPPDIDRLFKTIRKDIEKAFAQPNIVFDPLDRPRGLSVK